MSDLDSEVVFLSSEDIEDAIRFWVFRQLGKEASKVILEIVSESYNNGFRETKNIATVFVK